MWYPASGYRTESGKWKWRCVWHDDPNDHRVGQMRELKTRAGVTWLCDTAEQAKRKADYLNSLREIPA